MISAAEIRLWETELGVGEVQVRKDHLISHVLRALPEVMPGRFIFFGGTALNRMHLNSRVSEDIDLLAEGHRLGAAKVIQQLPSALQEDFPRLAIAMSQRMKNMSRLIASESDVNVQIDIMEPEVELPSEAKAALLRYSDLPETVDLLAPTIPSFAAMKMGAWADRREPRDLFDLAQLAAIGAIGSESVDLKKRLTGTRPTLADYKKLPFPDVSWTTQLEHQVASLPDSGDCLQTVATAVEEALKNP